MYRALQGRCGLFCGDCRIYAAYSTNDLAAQRRLARELGASRGIAISAEQIRCLGCKASDTSFWSRQCKIRTCAEERGLEFCYQCKDFPCEELQGFLENHPQARENLRTISKIGPDAWLAEMLAKSRGEKHD